MELDLEERKLIAHYRTMGEGAKKELLRFAAALCLSAQAAANDETKAATGSCKLTREEERPETAAEPICTE